MIAFDRAIILGLAQEELARMIGNIKSKSKDQNLTLEEFQKVMILLYKVTTTSTISLHLVLWLLFMTGMRIGEAVDSQWDDIDFETGGAGLVEKV